MIFNDIADISKYRLKNIVSKHIKEHAFIELIERKDKSVSEYVRRTLTKYEELDMQEYLLKTRMNFTLDEQKWNFKCRTNNIDLKANFNGNIKIFSAFHVKIVLLKQTNSCLNVAH